MQGPSEAYWEEDIHIDMIFQWLDNDHLPNKSKFKWVQLIFEYWWWTFLSDKNILILVVCVIYKTRIFVRSKVWSLLLLIMIRKLAYRWWEKIIIKGNGWQSIYIIYVPITLFWHRKSLSLIYDSVHKLFVYHTKILYKMKILCKMNVLINLFVEEFF